MNYFFSIQNKYHYNILLVVIETPYIIDQTKRNIILFVILIGGCRVNKCQNDSSPSEKEIRVTGACSYKIDVQLRILATSS